MEPKWTLTELTELDLRMHRHASDDSATLSPADAADLSRSEVLHRWLRTGRKGDPDALRLAETAVRSISWLTFSLALFSMLSGISAAAALLHFGRNPLMNVSSYLGVLIGAQLLMLIGFAVSAFLFRKRVPALQKLLLPRQVSSLSAPVSLRAWRWRIFGMLQTSGMLFNLGVLLMTLGKGLTNDLAFGWATTLDIGGESVHRLVQTLALPWGGGYAPSLEYIRESRITSTAAFPVFDRAATASWWPFIMLCVIVYGFFPRALLRLWGAFQLRRCLKRPLLDSPDCERLYLSLTRKTFAFSGSASDPAVPGEKTRNLPSAFRPEKPLRLLVDEDLLSTARITALAGEIRKRLNIETDPGAEGVLKLVELWQPPLEETLRELRRLREEIGAEADLLILGAGFPAEDAERFFEPPSEEDLLIWRKRLGELNDPHLGITPWREKRREN